LQKCSEQQLQNSKLLYHITKNRSIFCVLNPYKPPYRLSTFDLISLYENVMGFRKALKLRFDEVLSRAKHRRAAELACVIRQATSVLSPTSYCTCDHVSISLTLLLRFFT